MNKNKKGFTLIELLAVIVVLAIVMVLAATTVLPYVGEIRKKAFITEVNTLKRAAENGIDLIVTGKISNNYTKTDYGYCFTLENLENLGIFNKDDNEYDGIVKVIKNNNSFEYSISMKNNNFYINNFNGEITENDVNAIVNDMDIIYSCNSDVIVGEAYALYTADNQTLTFVRSETPYTVGGIYNDKTITSVYTGFETETYTSSKSVPWYTNLSNIKNITFADTIKPVSTAYWFMNMSLNSVDAENLNVSNAASTDYMFYFATVKNANLSNWNLASATSLTNMFAYATLTSVNMSGWSILSATSLSAILHDTILTGVNISNWNIPNVTSLSDLFWASKGDTSLASVNVSNWNTSSVTDMSRMFGEATIDHVTGLNTWDTSNVTNMSMMFQFARIYSNLGIGGWDTSNVTNMNSMFRYASLVVNLNLSGWSVANVSDYSLFADSISGGGVLTPPNWPTT